MRVQARANDSTAATADSAIQTITVSVTPVSEAPILASTDAVAVASIFNLDRTATLTLSPSTTLFRSATNTITISDLTAGASLSNTGGPLTAVAGVYTLSVAQLEGLTLHVPTSDT